MGEMNRGNSLSQTEVAAPGLLPYEDGVLCDEAESCSDSQHNRNLPGADIINMVVLMFEKKYISAHFQEAIYIVL